MKKSILVLVAMFILSIFPVCEATSHYGVAAAGGARYSRIMSEDVVLYMDSSLAVPWFTLPYSYYVKVISINGSSAKVEYRGDNPSKPSAKGYIGTDELNIVEEEPPVLYPSLTLTVNQTCMLYKDSDFTFSETLTQNSTVDFYGTLVRPNGEKYVYGLATTNSGDKYLGYAPVSAVFSFTVPVLKIEEESTEESVAETTSEKEDEPVSAALGSGVQLAVIIGVSAVAISIVYLLFRPSGKGRAKDEAISDSRFDDD